MMLNETFPSEPMARRNTYRDDRDLGDDYERHARAAKSLMGACARLFHTVAPGTVARILTRA
ncbi:hypothetical protein CHELA20_50242 [Hyphomicrobiales bacterium]|nr:hypothetical protein CHELA41_20130 [Hyphomicrobiales bacterium]CAH1667680.1 hypothetical protein CHELA20_50242 [Hyphomicrobiales bacterium]